MPDRSDVAPPRPGEAALDGLGDLLADGGSTGECVARIERLFSAVHERAMRRAVMVEALEALSPLELVAFMAVLLRRVRLGRGGARTVMQEIALKPTVFTALPYERVQAAYALARQANQDAIARMFLGARLELDLTEQEAFTGNEHLDIPLGVRRAAARTGDRFKLDRLLHDRDWRVIRVLLDNPRIVEPDVVRIAAMRPTRPEVLEEVARHRRWSGRYRVRKALAANPYTPTPVARRLLVTLMRQDLRQIVQAGILDPELQEEATEQLRALGDRGQALEPVGDDADLARLLAGLEAELDEEIPEQPGPEAPFTLTTSPDEDAAIEALVAVMEATLDGRPGGVVLVPVAEDEEPAVCALPPRRG